MLAIWQVDEFLAGIDGCPIDSQDGELHIGAGKDGDADSVDLNLGIALQRREVHLCELKILRRDSTERRSLVDRLTEGETGSNVAWSGCEGPSKSLALGTRSSSWCWSPATWAGGTTASGVATSTNARAAHGDNLKSGGSDEKTLRK